MRYLHILLFLPLFVSRLYGQEATKDDPLAISQVRFEKLTQEDLCTLLVKDTLREFALNNRFFIDGSSFGFGNIGYRQNGMWYYFSVNFDTRSIRIELIDIDRDGTNEVVVYGDRAQYGTGGGTIEHGISIYKIDTTVEQIFRIISGFSEEEFGAEHSNGIRRSHSCDRPVTIMPGEILISPAISEGDQALCGNLTDIAPGYYAFQYGQILQISGYPANRSKPLPSHLKRK